jgi:TonB-linked SusC/RagA family outer membrane protein
MLMTAGALWAQQVVSGVVTDAESGEPLEGVSVLVKGTTTGMFTDAAGRYSLRVATGTETLVFSFVGKLRQEVAISGQASINVSMRPDVLELDEVVVTAVGIEANKRQLGYAIQNVGGDELQGSKEVNLINALNSKAAGVVVYTSSGSPGASASIRIRGNKSINGSNEPLFVIDGVPIDNSEVGNGVAGVDQANRAIDINPNDVESLTILKGPAATALYGIRAANGAVIITTKRGKSGRARITLSGSVAFDQVNKLPDLQSTYAQGRPGFQNPNGSISFAQNSAGTRVPIGPFYRGPETFEGFSWGPAISDLEFDGATDYPYDQGGRLVPKGQGNGTPARAYDPYDFFVTGQTTDLNASVQGGNETVTYYISGGRLSQTGVVPKATFGRSTFRSTVEARLTSRLTASMSATFANSGGFRIQRGSNISGVMLGLLRNTPSFDIGNGKVGLEAAEDPAAYQLPDGSQRSYRAGIYDSPYWTVNKNPFVDNVNRLIGYASLKYDFFPWLSLSYKLGTDHYTDRRNSAIDINSATNPFGQVDQSFQSSTDLNSDLLLSFNRNIGSSLSVNAVAGHNFFSRKSVLQSSSGQTMAIPGFYHISNTTDVVAAEDIAQRQLSGVFASVNLAYNDYLFINLSGRNDWASTLPEGANSFFYPAASLGLTFTELLGLSENKILPYGKLRVSWGQVGNDAPLYSTLSYFGAATSTGDGFIDGTTFPAFGVNAFERSTLLGNNQLRPETSTTFEVGGELKFLQGRLGLDVTYFDSESRDQIIAVDISTATGYSNLTLNAGVISNKGWEVVLNATPIKAGDFTWTLDINWTRIRNLVEQLGDPELGIEIENIGLAGFTSTSSRAIVGYAYGAIFGNGFQRDDNGNVIVGANGWPLLGGEDFRGDPNPDWIAGVRNTFSFKGLSLTALLDIRQGGEMWCGTCGILNYFGTSQLSADERTVTGFIFEGVKADGTPNTTPVDLANPASPGGVNDYYRVRYGFGGTTEQSVQSTSWRRLREVSLSYQIPSKLLAKTPFSELYIAFTGRNLWLDTDFAGVDPETNLTGASNGFGLEYFNMPNTKSYVGSIRVSF